MRRPAVQWTLAIIITLVSAVWQRWSGPTYPKRGAVDVDGQAISLKLLRTHSITGRLPVTVPAIDDKTSALVEWRKFPTSDPWQRVPLSRQGDVLQAVLPPEPEPLMPAAGKLEYRVHVARGASTVAFPPAPAVARFKGDVPDTILIPHIFAMFFGMLFSTRAGLAAMAGGDTRRWSYLAVALLVVGGFVLGPIIQKLAFGAYWTGVPFGYDLTDNKTLIAGVAWILAATRLRGGGQGRVAVATAAVVTLVVFAIPHSVWGSEAKW